ncbi:MAG: NADH-quinone oxidoreductase subunit A [Dehalococcoidia bacterium]|nr:NADH-quinone oxidoreductase subunit A [Dehalococcoidia bacterium]
MLSQFGLIGILFVVAFIFPVVMLLISYLAGLVGIRPSAPSAVKSSTYECGMRPVGTSWMRFNFRYYFFALLFVVFDVETVFLFPWAVAYRQLAVFALVEMAIFIAILAVGLAYAWKKNVLEWK